MIINVHAGHNPDGKTASGAIGIGKESTMNRDVVGFLIPMLRELGNTVYDCTCNNGTSQKDVLEKIVRECNSHKADLDISIHHNSGANDQKGNGKTTGSEVYIKSEKSLAKPYAERTVKELEKLGFRNRGVKTRNNLYFLNHTIAPAMLIEAAFVDDKDDMCLWNAQEVARAICIGITGKQPIVETPDITPDHLYKVQCGAFKKRENAEKLVKDLKEKGFDAFITISN